jgi:type I restriction-modification system DNA methylase subunit
MGRFFEIAYVEYNTLLKMDKKSASELRAICKKLGVKGYSKEKKAVLLRMIETAEALKAATDAGEDREDTTGAAAAADAVDTVPEGVPTASRDLRMKFYKKIHNILWNRPGLDPRLSFDHMVFFFALFKLDQHVARDESFGPNCRWANIAANISDPGMIYHMLFSKSPDSAVEVLVKHRQTAIMFEGFKCMIKSEELVADLVRAINEFPFDNGNDTLGELFEYSIGRGNETMSDRGAYFTARSICRLAFDLAVKIKGSVLRPDGSLCTVFDPFCGTAGFLAEFIRGVNRTCAEPRDWMQDRARIFGCDIDQACVRTATINMLISAGVPFSRANIRQLDSFRTDIMRSRAERAKDESDEEFARRAIVSFPNLRDLGGVDFGMANPPYGGDGEFECYEGTGRDATCILSADIQHLGVKGNYKAAFGLQLCMSTLAPGGVQCIVMPRGFFFHTAGIFADLRRKIIEEYRVHYIVMIPSGAFVNSSVETGMLVFQAGVGTTENVQFLRLAGKVAHCSDYEIAKICTVSIEALREHSYQLTPDTYTCAIRARIDNLEITEHRLGDIIEVTSGDRISRDIEVDGRFPIYGGGDMIRRKANIHNREDTFIIGYFGGAGGVRFVGGRFFLNYSGCSIDVISADIADDVFVGCYLIRNQHVTKAAARGSIQKNLNKDIIYGLPIFLPSLEIQRRFARVASTLLLDCSRGRDYLSLVESRICEQIREMQIRHRELPLIAIGDLIEMVKFRGHPIKEGADVRDEVNRYPLLRTSRDGKIKWLPTCDIAERLIAMGNAGEANVTMRENFNISPHIITFRARATILLPFLYYVIKASIGYIDRKFFAGTCQHGLLRQQFLGWKITVPPLEEQHTLDGVFATAWDLTNHIADGKIALEHLMDRYVPRATITHDALDEAASEASSEAAIEDTIDDAVEAISEDTIDALDEFTSEDAIEESEAPQE